MSATVLAFIPLWLCWGSFLNVVSYRLIHHASLITPRSHCPHCNHVLAWYDLIPVLSWLALRGRCRYCTTPISYLYPFIELFTAVVMSPLLTQIPPPYFYAYFIFFSALIVTIRSDLHSMLISRYASLFLVPLGIALSAYGLLPITMVESILGAIGGFISLYMVSKLFYYFTQQEGMGQGDIDLLAFIGSFTGMYGCWISLLIGSLVGSVIGLCYMALTNQNRYIKIPFGPFLAIGAICFVLYKPYLMSLPLFTY